MSSALSAQTLALHGRFWECDRFELKRILGFQCCFTQYDSSAVVLFLFLSLQGYHKDKAYKELGLDQELVMQMRRSYDVRPPKMEDDHPYWHGNYRRYRKLSKEQLESSRTESLKDAADRIMPFYNSVIVPSLRAGNKCLIVSHANTIRTLIKNIDGISDEDIKGMSIPTGIPLLYRLDKNLRPVCPVTELEFRFMVEPKG